MSRHGAYPEWLTRDGDHLPWSVESGLPERGQAFTDLDRRRMQVPLFDDEVSRCIRAHELMHARVSPTCRYIPDDKSFLPPEILEHAEEFRVNQLVRAAGFPVEKFLYDGSEHVSGRRFALTDNWGGLVRAAAGMSGTRSFRLLVKGVAEVSVEMSRDIRLVDRALQNIWRSWVQPAPTDDALYDSRLPVDTKRVADSSPMKGVEVPGATEGWRFTLEVAEFLFMVATLGEIARPYLRNMVRNRRSDIADSLFSIGVFADLVEKPLSRSRRIDGAIGRRRRPATTGRNPRHMARLLTDPQRRVFDQRRPALGGVILIDQSGSMNLPQEDILRILRAAPGCTIIGYSHAPRTVDIPNVWIIAKDGHVADRIPAGNGGNGVDGPALRFAARHRRPGEPFIWVCDGGVTDRNDEVHRNLEVECARLVSELDVHQVASIDEARMAVEAAARGRRLPTRALGQVAGVLSAA